MSTTDTTEETASAEAANAMFDKIINFRFERERHMDAANTHRRLSNEAFATVTDEKILGAVFAHCAASDAFTAILSQTIASVITRELERLERDRDRMLTELFHANDNGLVRADAEVRDAAENIDIVLRHYRNPARQPMDAQTEIIGKILHDLAQPAMLPHLAKLPVCKAAVEDLTKINAEFSTLFDKRMRESEAYVTGLIAKRRVAVDAAAREVVRRINGYIDYMNEPTYDALVLIANTILKDAQHIITRRLAHRKGGEEGGEGAAPISE